MKDIATFIGYALIALLAFRFYSEWEKKGGGISLSQADCEVIAVETIQDTYIVNDNFDFGYTVLAKIRNVGHHGTMTIKAMLSTSEGNYERSQQLVFNPLQETVLRYQFAEPTINATGIQGRILCTP